MFGLPFCIALLNLMPGAKYIYSADSDSLRTLDYSYVYVHSDFLTACNDGVCSILNIDGSHTGIDGFPQVASVAKPYAEVNLFVITANEVKTFFYNSKKIDDLSYMLKSSNGFPFNLGPNQLCKDTVLLILKQEPVPRNSNKKKSKQVYQTYTLPSFIEQTKCYNLDTKSVSIIPHRLHAGFYGFGYNSGTFTNAGFIYGNKDILMDSLADLEVEVTLDGEKILRARPAKRKANNVSNRVHFDSSLHSLDNDFGSFVDRYGKAAFYAKQDAFGSDSLVVVYDNKRIGAHAFAEAIPFVGNSSYCLKGGTRDSLKCFIPESGAKFSLPAQHPTTRLYQLKAKTFETIGVGREDDLIHFSKRFFPSEYRVRGDFYFLNNRLFSATGWEGTLGNPGLYTSSMDDTGFVSTRLIAPLDDGRIRKVGHFFIIGAAKLF
jgi:hypothetical protein